MKINATPNSSKSNSEIKTGNISSLDKAKATNSTPVKPSNTSSDKSKISKSEPLKANPANGTKFENKVLQKLPPPQIDKSKSAKINLSNADKFENKNSYKSSLPKIDNNKQAKINLENKANDKAAKISTIRLNGAKFEEKVGKELSKLNQEIFSQVHTKTFDPSKGKRIDFVVGKKDRQPVSVKNSNWSKVQDTTWKKYINEARDYSGRIIHSQKYAEEKKFNGYKISSKPILVLPQKTQLSKNAKERLSQMQSYAAKNKVELKFI